MIVQDSFLQKLKQDFNLNIYETKIWTALLSRGISTAGELADISGVPRSRCYDVLETLEKKGFTIMKIGKPIKYIAVPPEEIVERVKKGLQQEAETSLSMLEDIRATPVFNELKLLYSTGIIAVSPEDLSHSLVGRDEIGRFMRSMLENAKKSAVIATTAEGFQRKVKWLKAAIKAKAKKGVKVKFIAPIDQKTAKKLENTAELKNIENKARFMIVDSSEMLFTLTDEATNPKLDTAVWVKSPYLVRTLEDMFQKGMK